jgi:hypothetical protein
MTAAFAFGLGQIRKDIGFIALLIDRWVSAGSFSRGK